MLVLCLPSRGADPYDGDEQDDGRDPHKDPFESMEHRSCHRVFRIGEIPLEIRTADRRQCDKDKDRNSGDCDAKGVQRTALEFRARANWSFSTSSFSESACRPSGSDAGTVSTSSVLTGVSSTPPMATSISASGTESPRSHFETVCLTTFSLSASSSWDKPFDFLSSRMFSFSIGSPFSLPVPTLPQCYPQMVRCHKQRDVTAGRNSAIA